MQRQYRYRAVLGSPRRLWVGVLCSVLDQFRSGCEDRAERTGRELLDRSAKAVASPTTPITSQYGGYVARGLRRRLHGHGRAYFR